MSKSGEGRGSAGRSTWLPREPFVALRDEMENLLGRYLPEGSSGWLSREFVPTFDLSETDDALEVRMDLPGMKPEEIEITVSGNMLRVHGERKEEEEEKKRTFHRVERRMGAFSRSITLPCAIVESKVKAQERNGVVTITLPKTEPAKTHKVKISGQ